MQVDPRSTRYPAAVLTLIPALLPPTGDTRPLPATGAVLAAAARPAARHAAPVAAARAAHAI
ncbi:hypothetical protein Sru01_46570 [Sphaerisporangium rufum]|uniref:Uncharacterized protein n=1 Tax=Sphaerisporangium rufum TaxID=1381558 RepID=A0A919R7J1_9ACTN|nr:hypothetical protein [Sphaerisporangium rufum]GII79675.1 hypothetical protein Sru01_46570 [Sphaerisporangium rufum]